MAMNLYRDPDLEWLDHVPPVGLVVASSLLKDLGLTPLQQTPLDTGLVGELVPKEASEPALADPWEFVSKILGWKAQNVAGAPGGPAIPDNLLIALPEHNTTLQPTWAVADTTQGDRAWQLLVRIEASGIDPDKRAALDGWEATPHQRFERLLRDTGVFTGLLITERQISRSGETQYHPEFRLIYAPRGETSGHQSFPIRAMASVAGRPMLGGLKLLLDNNRLFLGPDDRRLPALLKRSRDAQASVSIELAGQVLGALHEMLRGLDAAEPALIRDLAANKPGHLYEGLLTVLMRLVFVLYAEDRDLLPSRRDGRAREIYETSYAVRGLYAKLTEDAALNPDTMDERRGGWGGLLALFRLIHKGHTTGFVQARGGKLFDPDEFPFLEGRAVKADAPRVLTISDGCLLKVLDGLMTLKLKGQDRERLSYRTLDVEQIGSVYETVMGFTVEAAKGRVLAIKAGKNNRTPVFVALDDLLAKMGKDRIKELKEGAGRTLTAAQGKLVEGAKTVEDLASAFDSIVDERGSPHKRIIAAGTPVLQPTGERRRSGSHYTPRSLTAPIVKHALEPVFERLGAGATPEQVLELKVCDPAMGSGAFLVEACRAIGERLVRAWAQHPGQRPVIPADEDEELHARRLVAQRCLYGVDKNPRAVDLAKLSLWLATLARDHEFTFLDHALKCGDSLVGLTAAQIAAANWDEAKPGLPLFRQLVRDRVAEALKARAEIQSAPDDTMRAIQEARHRALEGRLAPIRTMGDAVVSAFFAADKAKARELARQKIEGLLTGALEGQWDRLALAAESLRAGENPVAPFHWQIEFPEVFSRENGGFDAIVGNPPFAGGNTIASGNSRQYIPWLQSLHMGAHGNADLVAHFFRRSFSLARSGGVSGLVATNTIGQGDTRQSGLTTILQNGGNILRAIRRLKWPGEAAVIVSVVHIIKGSAIEPKLDGKEVGRISAYLVEGYLDASPPALALNSRKSFKGSQLIGYGFCFDDFGANKGLCESIEFMEKIMGSNPDCILRIKPFITGEDVNSNPYQQSNRFVFDLGDLSHSEASAAFPQLMDIARKFVYPIRQKDNRDSYRLNWWKFGERTPGLYAAISGKENALCTLFTSSHLSFSILPANVIFANAIVVTTFDGLAPFAALQSRAHELWARFFSSTLEDRLRYAPSDCFRTFPFPANFETDPALEAEGEAYHAFRAQLMIARNEGLTKTYNRFHARTETAPDITRLRTLHAEMDQAVLKAYGWPDLAARATPEFIEQEADEGKTPKTRLDWPPEFKDEVLARLLALNAERAREEREAGLVAAVEEDEFENEPQ